MADPRPAQIVTALRRLGFVDAPKVGDHVGLWKKILDHPDGPVTIRTGLSMKRCLAKDISRIKRETHLNSNDLWKRALNKDLSKADYNKFLDTIPKHKLVIPFWEQRIKEQTEGKKADRRPARRKAKER